VVETVPIEIPPNPHNVKYLETKRQKMGHMLNGAPQALEGAKND